MRGVGTLRLGLVFAVLVPVNLYVFLWRDGTSLTDVRDRAMAAHLGPPAKPEPAAAAAAMASSQPPKGYWEHGTVQQGDSLARILGNFFTPPEADSIIRALRPQMNLRAIRAGQTYRIHFGPEGQFRSLEFQLSRGEKVRAKAQPEGEVFAERVTAKTEIRVSAIAGTIESSLYSSVKGQEEDVALVSEFVDIFAYDINFYIDTHEGDRFAMLVEKEYLHGAFFRYKRIRAAEYSGRIGTFRAFYWKSADGREEGYYDAQGRTVARTFLKTPLKFTRISSRFNHRRMHPILHRTRAHLGVDYAAPTGTPVWAAASGRIVFRGRRPGAGNCVVLNHANGYQTVYMHLSRFERGQRVGQSVRQKAIIGRVGSTGLATGPHLHFSVKRNGRYIDPLRMKMAPPRKLAPSYHQDFMRDIAPLAAGLGRTESGDTLVAAPGG